MSSPQINDQIRVLLDPFFNGMIIDGFGCGIYTLIFAQAIWKLYKKGNKALYSLSLILLWISSIISFVCDWAKLRAGFVVHNNSPIDVLEGFETVSPILVDTASILSVLIADAILIWRCNILWRNKFILILLLTLYFITAAFYIWTTAHRDTFSALTGFIALLASALTTASATFFIALKIVLVTRKSPMRRSYTKSIVIIVESGALVSIFSLAVGVLELISFRHAFLLTTTSGKILDQLSTYLSSLQTPIIGIGPTLIAFRVAEEETEVNATRRSTPLSRLTFGRAARNTTSNSQARDPHVSTIRFMTAPEEENLNSSQGSVAIEPQTKNLGKQEEQNNAKILVHSMGVESDV